MDGIYIIGQQTPPGTISVGAGESVAMTLVIMPGVSCDIRLDVALVGEGASFDLSGVYMCGSDEKVAITVNLTHKVGGCRSSQLFKGLVGGNARTDFSGRIVVEQDAQKTEAYQACHNILLSDGARAVTSPQLEIYADDVKCSHGATSGMLSEEEQFYMRSRGISLKEARVLQMISFVSPVLDTVSDPDGRRSLAARLEEAVRSL